jgi:outer membrane protein assembly factor BamE
MKQITTLILLALILSGCAWLRPHKTDIEQGNVITQTEINQLRIGMNEYQVKQIMGAPILINIFTPNRIDYVYTSQLGHSAMNEKRITCIFYRGRLQKIEKN